MDAGRRCARRDDVREETMPIRRALEAAIIFAGSLLAALPAVAADLTGVWITDLEACNKVFTGTGTKAAFRRDSDMFGSGFIIDGKRIRGRTASCTIDKMQEEKDGITHMLASCATEIMLQNVQFSVKLEDDKLTRIFPGIDGMNLTYYRCPAKPAAR